MSSTLPPIQPHTKAKHHILAYHLKEWFPILGRSSKSLRYIDGFAGPGEYHGGEPGSPIISLRTLKGHQFFDEFSRDGKSIEFLFVEKNPDYCRHLERKIEEEQWPSNFKVAVNYGEFESNFTRLLDDATTTRRPIPPTLLFVDPFGSAGFPMDLFKRLVSFDRVDVLINLNILEFVQWILEDPSKHVTANRLYGGPRWKPALKLEGRIRAQFLVEEYKKALLEIGWRTTSFEMVNSQNQTVYHLVFGTRNPKGMEAIKLAMRSASQTGEFRYTDRVDSAQPVLLGLDVANQYPSEIGEHLFRKYQGEEVAFDSLIMDEIDWHRWWLPVDLRKGLTYLEYGDDPRIAYVRNRDGRTRRKRSYPDGSYITFRRPLQRPLL